MKVTALAGGVGGAKLAVGLQQIADAATRAADLTLVVNTADDTVVYGVHVSPDVDIVTYWLAGIADRERGWGLKNDTFTVVDSLGRLAAESWFRLGDADLATCLFRTRRLAEGATLAAVTDEIRRRLEVRSEVLPMSDDPVRTIIHTTDGRALEFQEYFVKERHSPAVDHVEFAGLSTAKPAPGVIDAIAAADVVVLCPSNPYVSIGPILALPGVRNALADHPRVVAVTPIVGGKAIKGPADAMLAAQGVDVSAYGVASLYADFCNEFIVDVRDKDEVDHVRALGMDAFATETMMTDDATSVALARTILGL